MTDTHALCACGKPITGSRTLAARHFVACADCRREWNRTRRNNPPARSTASSFPFNRTQTEALIKAVEWRIGHLSRTIKEESRWLMPFDTEAETNRYAGTVAEAAVVIADLSEQVAVLRSAEDILEAVRETLV